MSDKELLIGLAKNATTAVVLQVAIMFDLNSSHLRPYVRSIPLDEFPMKKVLLMLQHGKISD